MAFKENQVANPTGAHTPATRHIATAHKKIRAKGKVHLDTAMDNIIKAVNNADNKFSQEEIFKASLKLIDTTLKAEAFYEKAIGTKPKEVSPEDDDVGEVAITFE